MEGISVPEIRRLFRRYLEISRKLGYPQSGYRVFHSVDLTIEDDIHLSVLKSTLVFLAKRYWELISKLKLRLVHIYEAKFSKFLRWISADIRWIAAPPPLKSPLFIRVFRT